MTIRPSWALYTCQRQNFPFDIYFHPMKGASHLMERAQNTCVFCFPLFLHSCKMIVGCELQIDKCNKILSQLQVCFVFQAQIISNCLSHYTLYIPYNGDILDMIIKRDISQTLSNIRNDVARKKDRRLKAVDAPVQSESVCHSSPSKPKTPTTS